MDWPIIILLAGGAILLILRAWAGPARPDDTATRATFEEPEEPEPEPEPWEADYLARYGTETSIDDLVAQGRAEDLRGLGYDGDLPGE